MEPTPVAWTCPVCARPEALRGVLRVVQVAPTPEPLYQYTTRITQQHCRCDPVTILAAWERQEQEATGGGDRQPSGA